MENQDITNAQNALLDAINNPKSNLQYQLYKLGLKSDALAESMISVAKNISEKVLEVFNSLTRGLSEYYRIINLGKEANPRVAYLAEHAKTQRKREKNIDRLYRIGCRIEKQRQRGDTP